MAEGIRVDAEGFIIKDDPHDTGVRVKAPSPARLAAIAEARRTGNYGAIPIEDAADQDHPQRGDYTPAHRQGIERLTPKKEPGEPDPFKEGRRQPQYGIKVHTRPVVRIVDGAPRIVHEEYTPKPPTG